MKRVRKYLADPPAWIAVAMLVVLTASIVVQFALHGFTYEATDTAVRLFVTVLWVLAAESYRYALKRQRARADLLELQRNAIRDALKEVLSRRTSAENTQEETTHER